MENQTTMENKQIFQDKKHNFWKFIKEIKHTKLMNCSEKNW